MDTTKEYIKMCEKAGEIQDSWDNIDWIRDFTHRIHDDMFIWLPRQDQLQDMIADKYTGNYYLVWNFYEFVMRYINCIRGINNNSMEQLWLAFVMKEKFNKAWNSEDWEVPNG